MRETGITVLPTAKEIPMAELVRESVWKVIVKDVLFVIAMAAATVGFAVFLGVACDVVSRLNP